MYLSASASLVNLTLPNTQSFNVTLEFKSHDHVSNSWTIKEFILLEEVALILF